MDFIAHFLWSIIIFAGPQIYIAVFFGVMPDLIPFGLNVIISPFQNRKNNKNNRNYDNSKNSHSKNFRQNKSAMIKYYQQKENKWVYKLYNYTHSIIIWAMFFTLFWIVGAIMDFFPIFMFAWLLHILIDIPTHTKEFFAPQFLTPLSKFSVNGKSWAHPIFMIINYLSLIISFIWRFHEFFRI